MRFPNIIAFILTLIFLGSCDQKHSDLYSNKIELKKIKDSLKNSINDSIAKSDSTKVVVGIVKLNKKIKVVLYDNYKWEYKNLIVLNTEKEKKVTQNQVKSIMKTIEQPQSEYVSNGTCGALTKKGGSCRRRVKGGGRCWQH